MTEWQIVRHTVSIAGRVIETETKKVIANARVQIEKGPSEFTEMIQLKAIHAIWKKLGYHDGATRSNPNGI